MLIFEYLYYIFVFGKGKGEDKWKGKGRGKGRKKGRVDWHTVIEGFIVHPIRAHYPFQAYEIDISRLPLVSTSDDGSFCGPIRRRGGEFLTVAPCCRQSGCNASSSNCRHRLYFMVRLQRSGTGGYSYESLGRIFLWAVQGIPCRVSAEFRLWVAHHLEYRRIYCQRLGRRRFVAYDNAGSLRWEESADPCRFHAAERRLASGRLGVRRRHA